MAHHSDSGFSLSYRLGQVVKLLQHVDMAWIRENLTDEDLLEVLGDFCEMRRDALALERQLQRHDDEARIVAARAALYPAQVIPLPHRFEPARATGGADPKGAA